MPHGSYGPETMPIRKSAFWEQKGSGNGQISRANIEEKKGRKNLKKIFCV